MCDQIIAKLVNDALAKGEEIAFDKIPHSGKFGYRYPGFHGQDYEYKPLSDLGCKCKFIPADPCPFCNGTGKDKNDPCPECNGTGKES